MGVQDRVAKQAFAILYSCIPRRVRQAENHVGTPQTEYGNSSLPRVIPNLMLI